MKRCRGEQESCAVEDKVFDDSNRGKELGRNNQATRWNIRE